MSDIPDFQALRERIQGHIEKTLVFRDKAENSVKPKVKSEDESVCITG